MSPYLIFSGQHAAVIEMPRRASAEAYGDLQKWFSSKVGGADKHAEMRSLWSHCNHRGVFWHDELAGPDGASFEVFQLPTTTISAVADCCKHIRRSFDVVSLRVLKFKTMHDIQQDVERIVAGHSVEV